MAQNNYMPRTITKSIRFQNPPHTVGYHSTGFSLSTVSRVQFKRCFAIKVVHTGQPASQPLFSRCSSVIYPYILLSFVFPLVLSIYDLGLGSQTSISDRWFEDLQCFCPLSQFSYYSYIAQVWTRTHLFKTTYPL